MLWGNVAPEHGATVDHVAMVYPHCSAQGHGRRPLFADRKQGRATATVIDSLTPEYPLISREAGVDGSVVIAALVCEHGNVVDEKVVRSIPMLDAAALSCVAQWKFQPTIAAGNPVAVWTEIGIHFRLQ